MEYILKEKDDACFLCAMFRAAPDHDATHLLLWRGTTCAIVMNRYPYNNGHLMIAPFRHIDCVTKLTPEEQLETAELTNRALQALRTVMNPEGFNLGYNLGAPAGAGLKDHVHRHLVPRWTGDTNFMPVIGNARCIPQALEATRQQLRAALEAQTP
jgi:ATP adenylyltransferase